MSSSARARVRWVIRAAGSGTRGRTSIRSATWPNAGARAQGETREPDARFRPDADIDFRAGWLPRWIAEAERLRPLAGPRRPFAARGAAEVRIRPATAGEVG